MKYVYRVTFHHAIGAAYFSSWIKAFNYCKDLGFYYRKYESDYLTQLSNESTDDTADIKKETVK